MNNLIKNNKKTYNKRLESIANNKFRILNKNEFNEVSGGECHQEYYCETIIGGGGKPQVVCGIKVVC